MNSSLETQLSPECFKQLGVQRAFGELGEAFAQDAKAMSTASFDRGVAHGKWLAGIERRMRLWQSWLRSSA